MLADHPLGALAATWRGAGQGEYPTIASFSYTEELVITPVPGRPLAHWRSTTRDDATGEPRHAESGFLRAAGDGVELVVAHGFGIVETAAGSFDGRRAGAAEHRPARHGVGQARRRGRSAATRSSTTPCGTRSPWPPSGSPLTHHLRAELQRV